MQHRVFRRAFAIGALVLRSSAIGTLAFVLALPAFAAATASEVAAIHRGPEGLAFEPQVAHAGGALTVTGPDGWSHRQDFAAGEVPAFSLSEAPADGLYRFELRLTPSADEATRRALIAARTQGDLEARATVRRFQEEGKLPARPLVTSGTFTVARGTLLGDSDEGERAMGAEGSAGAGETFGRQSAASSGITARTAADQLFIDDVIITQRLCVGNDCANGETFGIETLRLKEVTTGVAFVDTSAGAFPSNDWQLTINDAGSGGANKFSIDDVTGSRTPFTVEAGSRTDSLYVDSADRVGFGTGTPVEQAHFVVGDTPTLRLEQDGSSTFTPQSWDVGANEVNFFVRDVTHSSKFPFKIKPDAPTDSLFVAASGDLGVGTGAPLAGIHVVRAGTEAVRDLLQLTNNGRVRWRLQDTSADGQILTVRLAEGNLDFSFSGTSGDQVEMMDNGDMTIAGTLTESSDRDKKHNVVPVEQQEILAKVVQLPLTTWQRIDDEPEVTHLGPMAQDFHALFGLGVDNRHIATIDTSGVALAAIQALSQKLEEKQQRIDSLEARLAALEAKLSQ